MSNARGLPGGGLGTLGFDSYITDVSSVSPLSEQIVIGLTAERLWPKYNFSDFYFYINSSSLSMKHRFQSLYAFSGNATNHL